MYRNHVPLLFWMPKCRSGTSCRYSSFLRVMTNSNSRTCSSPALRLQNTFQNAPFQAKINNHKRCHQVQFSSPKYTKVNVFVAAALPRTPLGELTALPRPHGFQGAGLWQGRERGTFPHFFFYNLTTEYNTCFTACFTTRCKSQIHREIQSLCICLH